MTSISTALTSGATHVLQWGVQKAATRRRMQIFKTSLSSDRSLQPDSVKLDSLVIAHQPWRGEYVPGPCTHRPSSHGESGVPKVRNRKGRPRVIQVTGG